MTPADLKAIRAKLKLTHDQLGAKLGTTGRTIRRYEAGERKIPKHVDIMLASEIFQKGDPVEIAWEGKWTPAKFHAIDETGDVWVMVGDVLHGTSLDLIRKPESKT